MSTRISMGSGALIAALLGSTAAYADVTPSDVWGTWRGYLEDFGYDVTADTAESGGTLTVSNMSAAMELPEDQGSMTITMGGMAFTDNGDGTVSVAMPETMPIVLHVEPTEGEVVDATLDYNLAGMTMVVSGDPDAMTYTYSADTLGMSLAELKVDGAPVGNAKFDISMADVQGNSSWATGAMRDIKQTMTTGTITYDIAFIAPDEGSLTYKGSLASIEGTSDMSMPLDESIDMADMNAALKAGMSISGAFIVGAGQNEFSFTDGESSASGNSSSTGGSLTVVMNKDQLRYGISSKGLSFSMVGTDVPLPVNVSMDELAFDFSIPVSKSDTPQDFALLVKFIGLAPDGMIWGIADPGGVLPHDPADLVLDLAGKANWAYDIMDPAQADNMGGADMPGELHGLTVKDLRLKLAGAELTGMGDFTFDMNDMTTFDGMPAPDGTLDLKLVGGNGLIDNLITMGLLTDDDAQGARMMMGLFGRPGEGDDELLSTIEVKKTGEISANGQRLQ